MSTSKPPLSSAPPAHGGNGKYIAVAVVLLLGMGGLVAWKLAQSTPPTPTPVATATSATAPPPPPKFDDIPPPPPTEDAGPATASSYHGPAIKPCDVTACGGSVTPDTEASLGVLAKQTRRKCYEPALAQDPSLMGHVEIRLKIAGNGDICASSVDSADTGLQQVGECTARIIAAAGHVPAPHGCVNIKFPLNYKPQGK